MIVFQIIIVITAVVSTVWSNCLVVDTIATCHSLSNDDDFEGVTGVKFKGTVLDWGMVSNNFPNIASLKCYIRSGLNCVGQDPSTFTHDCVCSNTWGTTEATVADLSSTESDEMKRTERSPLASTTANVMADFNEAAWLTDIPVPPTSSTSTSTTEAIDLMGSVERLNCGSLWHELDLLLAGTPNGYCALHRLGGIDGVIITAIVLLTIVWLLILGSLSATRPCRHQIFKCTGWKLCQTRGDSRAAEIRHLSSLVISQSQSRHSSTLSLRDGNNQLQSTTPSGSNIFPIQVPFYRALTERLVITLLNEMAHWALRNPISEATGQPVSMQLRIDNGNGTEAIDENANADTELRDGTAHTVVEMPETPSDEHFSTAKANYSSDSNESIEMSDAPISSTPHRSPFHDFTSHFVVKVEESNIPNIEGAAASAPLLVGTTEKRIDVLVPKLEVGVNSKKPGKKGTKKQRRQSPSGRAQQSHNTTNDWTRFIHMTRSRTSLFNASGSKTDVLRTADGKGVEVAEISNEPSA